MTMFDFQLLNNSDSPKYKQIADAIAQQIESGILNSNDKLPTHRALADKLQVTVGTITRAYAEAERRGLLEARVGAGTFVVDQNKAFWAFHTNDPEASEQCNFNFNIPPVLDRSEMLKDALDVVSRSPQALNQFMTYQSPTGIPEHKQVVCNWLNQQGIKLSVENMLFSSGAQHAMQIVLESFTRSGDTILVEKLTYPGMISLARQKQLTIKGVEMDEQGILPEALEAACKQYQARFIYLTPTLQNPTTATMSLQRREKIIDICKQNDLIIIEDDVNGLLPIDPPPPLVNLAPEQVIYIGAVSKCLAPGLRVGFLHAPEKLYQQLTITLQNQSWMISPLLTAITCELIRSNKVDQVLKVIRNEMAERQALMLDYLAEYQPRYKDNCFHVWLTLPEQWRLSDFIEQAEQQGVMVKSAELFTPPAAHVPPAVRIALSSPFNQIQLESGLSKLKELLADNPVYDFGI